MKVKNIQDYALFDYQSEVSNSLSLGEIVINTETNEIGVIIQIHSVDEFRTDCFGNSSMIHCRKAKYSEIYKFRPNLLLDDLPFEGYYSGLYLYRGNNIKFTYCHKDTNTPLSNYKVILTLDSTFITHKGRVVVELDHKVAQNAANVVTILSVIIEEQVQHIKNHQIEQEQVGQFKMF